MMARTDGTARVHSFLTRSRPRAARRLAALLAGPLLLALVPGCGSGGGRSGSTLLVNSLADTAQPAVGAVTLRSAVAAARSGDTIAFDSALDGGTIDLTIVGDAHSALKGETYAGMSFGGYEDRDYGPSALYARKNLEIDASRLPHGITLRWKGGDARPARVLAVYGDLAMKNVTVTGGISAAGALAGGSQPYTLARGGGIAVWGTAALQRCAIAGNRCVGDAVASRDRGTYGGGIYANGLALTDCVVSGNSAVGYGAAGGGIYSVGGVENVGGRGNDTSLARCTVSGNRVTAQHAYGGGVFTLSGGPNNLATMYLANCTIARNLAEDNPALPEAGPHYYRGGGVYMGGGSLSVTSCTIVENEVTGHAAVFSGKPNIGGGGIAATVGNAHTVEDVWVQHSVVAGNRLNGAAEDWFAGSLLNFTSGGYNLFGVLDFRQILAPCPDWTFLSRKHYPKAGDRDGVALAQALDLGGTTRHASFVSAGTDAGQPAVLSYAPGSLALDRIPPGTYALDYVHAGYAGFGKGTDDFLNHVLARVRAVYGSTLGAGFGAGFGDMAGVTWYGPRVAWPSEPANAPWIAFWRQLDAEIGDRLGMAGLGDEFWGSFASGPLGGQITMQVERSRRTYRLVGADQAGRSRPSGGRGDVGAIER